MRYKVTKNGDNVLITDSLKHAGAAYNRAIYYAKSGDIIKMEYRENPSKPWATVRKDWI